MTTVDSPANINSLACDGMAVEALSLNEPAWMQTARRQAWTRFEQTAMPGRTDEAWRRLDLRGFDPAAFRPAASPFETSAWPANLRTACDLSADQIAGGLAYRNNHVHRWISPVAHSRGVVVSDLASALATHASTLEPLLTSASTDGKLANLSQALWNRGTFIYVPRHAQVELPLHALLVESASGVGYFPRTVIVLDDDAQATVIEESLADASTGANLSGGLTTIWVKAGARLAYAQLQQLGSQTRRFLWQQIRVERNGQCVVFNGEFGGQQSRIEVTADLLGPGARSELFGLVMGRDQQHVDVHTFQQHTAPQTSSDLLYKSVLRDRARATYQGLIRVTKAAQKTDAYQANRNLLLSHEAKAESIPKLEIEADDVRCTHGATVGHVDEELQFYLRSRGLSLDEADRMIVDGFVGELLARLPQTALRDRTQWHLQRLPV